MKLRLGFVARNINQDGYGVSTYVKELYTSIAQEASGHEIYFLTDSHVSFFARPAFQSCIVEHIRPEATTNLRKLYWDHCAIPFACKRLAIDVLFAPYQVRPIFLPCASVTCVHDMMYHLFPDQWGFIEGRYMKMGIDFSTVKSDQIIVDSQSTKSDFLRFFPKIEKKLKVVYPGVPEDIMNCDLEEDRNALQRLNISEPYILYVGNGHPRKNARLMVDLYCKLESDLDQKLVMIGPDFGKDSRWFASLRSAQASDKIVAPGLVSREEYIALLKYADFLAFPSSYEGFGFPVLEAISQACPVLCFNNSSLPEIIGEAGVVVKDEDRDAFLAAMINLSRDRVLRSKLAGAGLERSKRFSWKVAARQVLETMSLAANCS